MSNVVLGVGKWLTVRVGAAVYLLCNGRIMGASGILGGLLERGEYIAKTERLAFIAGLIGMPLLLRPLMAPHAQTHLTGDLLIVIMAGLLVGAGTRIVNGRTSGYGVCGISRFSLRGSVATVFYILAGGLTVVLFRHALEVI